MLRLLKIEWNKIYYYKTARIFTILYFAMLVIIGLALANFEFKLNGIGFKFSKLGMFNFPVVWQNITWFSALAKIFIAIIVITNVTNEYSSRTLKQNLIDGLSKKEFLVSKVLSNTVLAILSTILVFLISLILGCFFSEEKSNVFQGMGFVLMYFIKLFFFLSMCLFFSFLLRKNAFAFLGIVVFQIIEVIFWVSEILIRKLVFHQDFTSFDGFVSNYLPLNSCYNLISFADFSPGRFLMGEAPFRYTEIDFKYIPVAIVYSFVFLFLSYRLLKKRDL